MGKTKIDTQWLFAIPVYSAMLEESAQRRDAMIELVLQNRARHPGIKRSNLNAWHSENNLHRWDNDNIRWLNQQVGDFTMACLQHFGPPKFKFDIVLQSAWANICGPNGWNAPHNHIPNHWSGVYYLSVEDPADNEPDTPPDSKSGQIEFLNPIQLGSFFGLPTGVSYKPKNGQIYLFHSALMHLVHPHLSSFERISIAFNLDVVPSKN